MIRNVLFLCPLVPRLLALTKRVALVISFSAIVAAGAAIPRIAVAAPLEETTPIQMPACRINWTRTGTKIKMNFINLQAAPADVVHFTIVYGGVTREITDRGTFSQGVRIAHIFPVEYGMLGPSLPEKCVVDYVHFSNGTTWSSQR